MHFLQSLKDQSDLELLKAFKESGNNDYIGELFLRYSHLVLFICNKHMETPLDAEDTTMEIFESLPKSINKSEISNFKSWLGTLTRNFCLAKLRKNKNFVTVSLEGYKKNTEKFMHIPDFEHLLSEKREKLLQYLEVAVGQLDEPQQKCIELFYYQEKSFKEIMEIMNCNWDQVRSYMQNARRNIQITLNEKVKDVQSIRSIL